MRRMRVVMGSAAVALTAVLAGCAGMPEASPSTPDSVTSLTPSTQSPDSIDAWAEVVLPPNSVDGSAMREVGGLQPGVRTAVAQYDVTQPSGDWTLQVACAARRGEPMTVQIRVDEQLTVDETVPCGTDLADHPSTFDVSAFAISGGASTTVRVGSDTLATYVLQLVPNRGA